MADKKRVKPQSKFFYTQKWTKEVDQAFINYLAWRAEHGYAQSNPDQTKLTALVFAQKAVNYDWDWDQGQQFYEGKLQLLRQRCTTFDAILQNPAFSWNTDTNKLQASKERWDAIVCDIPFANAYRWRGEAKWELLCKIFEGDDLDDPERNRQKHAVEPNAARVGVGGFCDDDDGIVFLGTSDGNEPHDVVD
ncbi:hypothetical protein Salat_2078900 [Sesamum alatum]|uniref:Myb/SANT-like domain-containing protein n=1 Tax=Sesamum alatum TaxID=300844 RepID=A0AAE1Y0A5_9LAMI|nr:hypothetical protein Salat_2078900 [Sesamum alatum]